jgi:hypothetical protein
VLDETADLQRRYRNRRRCRGLLVDVNAHLTTWFLRR